ncbi:glutathione transferase GstA [Sphingomonas quercus]|uniref:Glutathione transferase GstA n=1 Tax=Sphingomonas quercus TaxID=2842451 RepID=A0ABS6BHT9_9SPHN|nr:glutathione transferase GstA [Sphingomonas quercus]MBU3077866.1 glutathione transferase GstA [Sphingomonas quercus]
MKLFYLPGACSLAPHIVANEAGIAVDLVRVDGRTKATDTGDDLLAVSPNGYVPVLVLDDGGTLTESSVIVQYLADLNPAAGLIPPAGDFARYKVEQWLAFIATELHKSFGPLFRPDTPEQTRATNRAHLNARLSWVDGQLAGKSFLVGETYGVADIYLWTLLGWAGHIDLDLAPYANILRFRGEIATRPAVVRSLKEEGLA